MSDDDIGTTPDIDDDIELDDEGRALQDRFDENAVEFDVIDEKNTTPAFRGCHRKSLAHNPFSR